MRWREGGEELDLRDAVAACRERGARSTRACTCARWDARVCSASPTRAGSGSWPASAPPREPGRGLRYAMREVLPGVYHWQATIRGSISRSPATAGGRRAARSAVPEDVGTTGLPRGPSSPRSCCSPTATICATASYREEFAVRSCNRAGCTSSRAVIRSSLDPGIGSPAGCSPSSGHLRDDTAPCISTAGARRFADGAVRGGEAGELGFVLTPDG
jgi:hypothetical protein